MGKLFVATRGPCIWRERLADPGRQWKRKYSAFETAVSWEIAGGSTSGIPPEIEEVLTKADFLNPSLLLGIAEHQVPLDGGTACSQCDVWALVDTDRGKLSLSVEAKAKEPFGTGNQSLSEWLVAGKGKNSAENRANRWRAIRRFLPPADDHAYDAVAYQILHRCAAAVIEVQRFGLDHAAFVVQAFGETPESSLTAYSKFCHAAGTESREDTMATVTVNNITLGIGWVASPLASDQQIAKIFG